MSCVFSWGSLVLPALSVGEISFANQKEFTECVAGLHPETPRLGFHLPAPLPSHLRVPWLQKKASLSPRPPRERAPSMSSRQEFVCALTVLIICRGLQSKRSSSLGISPHAGSGHRDLDVGSPGSF